MRPGMMGALIVTMVLMVTVFAGFMTSVDKVATTTLEYDYVTDGTSLFSYTSAPEYVDYSPNTNYTHYTTDLDTAQTGTGASFYTSGIAYTETSKVNQYRVYEAQETTTFDIDLSTMTFGSYVYSAGASNHKVLLSPYSYTAGSTTNYAAWDGYVAGPKVITLQALLDQGSYTATGAITTFTIPSTVWLMYGSNFHWGSYYGYSDYFYAPVTSENSLGPDYREWTVTYDPSGGTTTVYRGTDGLGMFTGTASQVYLIYGGTYHSGASVISTNYPPTGAMTASYTTVQPATYMDVSQGVTFGDSSVYWTNGYTLGSVTMLLDAPDSDSSLVIGAVGSSNSVTVSYSTSTGYALGSKVLGKWINALLTVDFQTDTVTLTGVNSIVSMVDYSASTYSVSETVDLGSPSILQFSGSDWTASVNSTRVFMDSYSTIMQDPSVDLSKYFASSDYLRLNFDSFAYIGDSVTINGHTYEVTNGKISVESEGVWGMVMTDYDLTRMQVTWDNGEVWLSFKNSNTTVDLGETSTKSISFAGDWYFDAEIYEGHQVNSTEYKFNPGNWDFSEAATLLVFLGLLILIGAIIKVTKGLGLLDIVILVCAGLVGYILLG